MSQIDIDFHDVNESCPHCKELFTVSRGSVYDGSEGVGIYLAALHNCSGGRTGHLAIAVKEGYGGSTETWAAALQVVSGEMNFEMSLVDPEYSPWKDTDYLGRMLHRDEVIAGSLSDTIFHIADHIVTENLTVNSYLTDRFANEEDSYQ